MSEVTSVNGQTGVVVLTTADVEAVATSEVGQPSGVASLNGSGELPEAQLPSSVVKSSPESHSEVEGNITPSLAGSKNALFYPLKGNSTLQIPTGTEKEAEVVEVIFKQVNGGGHTLAYSASFNVIGEAPSMPTGVDEEMVLFLATQNGGITWNLLGLQPGPKGEKGEKGAQGPEGFNAARLGLPTEFLVFKSASESGTEAKKIIAESYPRYDANSTLILTSGTPVGTAIWVPAKTVISGIAFGVQTVEETAANRTHLVGALLKGSTREVLRLSADYTNAAQNPCETETERGLKFETTYETGAEPEWLVALLWETMSATKPITVVAKVVNIVTGRASPKLSTAGPTGRTNPASLTSPVALSVAEKMPWFGLF